MKIKKASKYIDSKTIEKAYVELRGADRIIFSILHHTGIRISEVEQYINKAKTLEPNVRMTPAKKNWDRIIPNYLPMKDFFTLKGVSIKKDALRKRIARWRFGFSAHDLRATFISNGIAKDIPIVKIQRLVGHREISSTLKYLRITTEHDVWMYDYITSSAQDWTESDNVQMLKQQLSLLSKQNAKLKFKLERGK